MPDMTAIQYARLKLQAWLRGIYPTTNPPQTWEEFVQFLKLSFFPASWSIILRLNLCSMAMQDNNFHAYLANFKQALSECGDVDDKKRSEIRRSLGSYVLFSVTQLDRVQFVSVGCRE